MITIFTTTKPFYGKNKINQINALRSWRKFSADIEIIVFGELTGDFQIIDELKIKHFPEIELYENKLPTIRSMFSKINGLAHNSICCYINADIILPAKFFNLLKIIHQKLKNKYLLCGQRFNFEINEEINFNDNWENEFIEKYQDKMELNPPNGSDYFVFPKNQYNENDIPLIIVGRPAWDLWMVYNGVKQRKIRVVNISKDVIVYHQNHESNYKPFDYQEKDVVFNHSFLPENEKFKYTLIECNRKSVNFEVIRNDQYQYKHIVKSFLLNMLGILYKKK